MEEKRIKYFKLSFTLALTKELSPMTLVSKTFSNCSLLLSSINLDSTVLVHMYKDYVSYFDLRTMLYSLYKWLTYYRSIYYDYNNKFALYKDSLVLKSHSNVTFKNIKRFSNVSSKGTKRSFHTTSLIHQPVDVLKIFRCFLPKKILTKKNFIICRYN